MASFPDHQPLFPQRAQRVFDRDRRPQFDAGVEIVACYRRAVSRQMREDHVHNAAARRHDAAAVFLDSLPAVEKLMPPLDVRRLESKVDERAQQRRQGRYDA